jgi:ribonucleoside-triphosphate reductase
MVSTRAEIVTRRTYNRPKDKEGKKFETWEETIDRVISHQRWLWARAKKKPWQEEGTLKKEEEEELEKLRTLFLERKALPSGRTLWLGGTEVSKIREASQFNCSFLRVETVHDVVDAYWLLLQGCGVGFEPVVGTLNGFTRPVELEVIRSTKTDFADKGNPENVEWFREGELIANGAVVKGARWHIRVGDSAEAWAKLPGKLLANKIPCEKLTLDFSEIRPAGTRLSSYGWISSGDELIADAMSRIVTILNLKNNRLLSRIDILDILNLLGSTLSSRRSAEICLVPFGDPETHAFINAKSDLAATPWRTQSNNSLLFYHKPARSELKKLFDIMVTNGGSEPGLINAQAALKRAPWFKGVNPCAEILLSSASFCCLSEIDVASFNGDFDGLCEAARLIGRANYRQTCVDLRDGILQRKWHENSEFLHLCGVGLTGIVGWEHLYDPGKVKAVMKWAGKGATSQARELRLPLPKAVTTVKPSGTLSKIMDTTEGIHKPLGRYVFNNVKFSIHDPIVTHAKKAGYRCFDDPYNKDAVLITFPVEYKEVRFETVETGGKQLEVNFESAIDQLERYRWIMDNYVEHNCSITVSYDKSEVPGIIDWILSNWDTYVGVSFLFRNDPTKTAEDLGYAYLPQEVVTKEVFETYTAKLKPLKLVDSLEELQDEGCSTGACPIR